MLIKLPQFLYWGRGITETQFPHFDVSWGILDSLPCIWLNGFVVSFSMLEQRKTHHLRCRNSCGRDEKQLHGVMG